MNAPRFVAAAAAALLALSVAACSDNQQNTTASNSSDSTSGESFTITHAFGETTINGTPQRVATVGWGNHEIPLALGVVPVGMSKATWGDDDGNGILPWVEDKLKELGGEQPALFDETDGIPFEQVADTKPDVILAAYSGLTQEDYDKLSKIAPVVAQPGEAWATTLEQMNLMDSQGINKAEEGKKLDEQLKARVADAMKKHPELEGKKVLFTSFGTATDGSKIGFYTTDDPRMGFLADAGLGVPEVVKKAAEESNQFYVERSLEKPEQFEDVDLMVAYGEDDPKANEKALKKMQKDPLFSRIPAIKEGRVLFLGNGPQAAATNPSPLALEWGIDEYFTKLSDVL
ncbi:iron-siderophore ABC transporter substrate-binding protein [Corynebacterium sp. 320]|uniref:iron-siderophore ABC transporter substrate-binding protein n=1 Tax=Corynebacterium TaxID=1716 RepID=UPI00125CB675|nr:MULTISPECIES: iron-siderophore ABC transporter substrate-binding protein [Corynebacterium]KAB1503926.1 iron-siderophore ABC transporter substrate-binding protein [Corynebacterium sp. 320]KAB1552975.1 iron-siderophore ABC transporter substrate-binding protein [Corynebacterium sp. 321]KAB1553805.1 iron-siderophore ABC transporter substrate-binding protein [Corynebacterium sp. 319]KAB3528062.1 iron-siderophore ABC transporter substrate-binding protein [Corynebacterium sp. 250]KAB3540450.1 iron